MTIENAADLVKKERDRINSYDLFAYFIELFELDSKQVENFAILCGFINKI